MVQLVCVQSCVAVVAEKREKDEEDNTLENVDSWRVLVNVMLECLLTTEDSKYFDETLMFSFTYRRQLVNMRMAYIYVT